MTAPRVAGVVLAAGASSRMDAGFKLLLPFGDGVVVEGPVRAALEAGLDPVVVVTGHRGEEVRRTLEDGIAASADPVRFVHNPRWIGGQAGSLARGIRAVRADTDAAAAAVLVGDEPGIRSDAVAAVVEAWRRASTGSRPPVVRAWYRDRPGHPVVFPREVFGELEALTGDRGARDWLERNAARVEEVRLDRPAPADVDTDEDYRAAVEDAEGSSRR